MASKAQQKSKQFYIGSPQAQKGIADSLSGSGDEDTRFEASVEEERDKSLNCCAAGLDHIEMRAVLRAWRGKKTTRTGLAGLRRGFLQRAT